jgi:membrane protein YdbS with pleckstrin-like domain
MITLQCDNCEKPFEIDDEASGEKVICPYCGDVNRVPGAAGEPPKKAVAAPVKAATSSVQPAPTRAVARPIESDAEQTIDVVRQAMFRAHPFGYSLLVLVLLGGIALAVLAATTAQFANSRWLQWAGLAMVGVAVIWWLVWWAAPHRWIKLTITNKRTIRQEGIIMRKTSEVMHHNITNITIRQSLLNRLLNVGYIGIDAAGQGGEIEGDEEHPERRGQIEIEVSHIPHPYRIKEIIDRYR